MRCQNCGTDRGWDEDGKGPSIWDTFGHTPGKVWKDVPGDVACDSYHRYRDDIALMKRLGLNTYRMSLSWPRILPHGTGRVNEKGLDYYDRVVDGLLEAGIAPNVTLYHWDLPQALEDRGGWANRDVAEWFAEYAAIVFNRLGDRIRRWATLNEPIALWIGYGVGWFAPGRSDPRAGRQAMHNAMVAHGRGVQAFRAAGSPGRSASCWTSGSVSPPRRRRRTLRWPSRARTTASGSSWTRCAAAGTRRGSGLAWRRKG